MARSCSQWWKAPVYFTISAVLAFMAISTAIRSTSPATTTPTTYRLSLNASRALRRSGFNTIATLLQISPEIIFSSSNSTIFAIQDSAIANVSLPPWLLKHLLQYHTSPLKLSINDILNMPKHTCLPTLLPQKNLAITKNDVKQRSAEINHVIITHPDLFLQGPLSIHGVLRPFSSLDPQNVQQGWNYIQSPICDDNSRLVSDLVETKNIIEWTRIIHLLSSNGFISFAIALHSVLDGILEKNISLNSTTIFAPPYFAFVASPSPLLDRLVRYHILPRRLTYKELSALPDKTSLSTLVANQDLQLTVGVKRLAIDGVPVVAPDIFSSDKFVVHGISQAFGDDQVF